MKNFKDFLAEAYSGKNPHISSQWPDKMHKKIDLYHDGKYHSSTNAYKNLKSAKAGHMYNNPEHDPKNVKAVYSESLEESLNESMVKVKQGDRVELHHHVSSGEAHGHTGKIVKVGSVDHRTTIATDPKNLHHIKMDKSGEVLKVHPGNVKNITESLDEAAIPPHSHFVNGAMVKHDKDNDNRMHMHREHGVYHIAGFKKGKHFRDSAQNHAEAGKKFSQHKREMNESLQEAKDWQTGKSRVDAAKTHARLHKEVGQMLGKIAAHHKKTKFGDDSHWGHVGDMGRLHAKVKDIHDMLHKTGEYKD